MTSPRRSSLALFSLLAALALASCGGDDEKKDSGGSDKSKAPAKQTQTQADTQTDTAVNGATGGSPDARAKAITSCLERKGENVVKNPATQVGGEYQLVVSAGAGGIVYGFKDDATAEKRKSRVVKEEDDRDVEVTGDVAIATFPADNSLAKPGARQKLTGCAG